MILHSRNSKFEVPGKLEVCSMPQVFQSNTHGSCPSLDSMYSRETVKRTEVLSNSIDKRPIADSQCVL